MDTLESGCLSENVLCKERSGKNLGKEIDGFDVLGKTTQLNNMVGGGFSPPR